MNNFSKKCLTYTVRYAIIYTEGEVRRMRIIKKVLIYLVHRQAQKQIKVRQQNNRKQIKLILQNL